MSKLTADRNVENIKDKVEKLILLHKIPKKCLGDKMLITMHLVTAGKFMMCNSDLTMDEAIIVTFGIEWDCKVDAIVECVLGIENGLSKNDILKKLYQNSLKRSLALGGIL